MTFAALYLALLIWMRKQMHRAPRGWQDEATQRFNYGEEKHL